MIIAVDFDDTVVSQNGRDYADVKTPLRPLAGAFDALFALKKAGHTLILFSARANRSLLDDPYLDPLVRVGKRKIDIAVWERERAVAYARMTQMVEFVSRELPGIFDVIDDGQQGKPHADLFVDDKALRLGHGAGGFSWQSLRQMYGEI